MGPILSMLIAASVQTVPPPRPVPAPPSSPPIEAPVILVEAPPRPQHHDWRDKYHGGHIHCMQKRKRGVWVHDCK